MNRPDMLTDLPYCVGGLLYTPAINTEIAQKLINHEYANLTSIAFCLEDSIDDAYLPIAEQHLKETLKQLINHGDDLPLIFIRVRDCDHLFHIHNLLGREESVVAGYIFPKFDLSNVSDYCRAISEFNEARVRPLFMMPILESKSIADIGKRVDVLWDIKSHLDNIKPFVLNIRVGGNDLSNLYGLRRSDTQTIYDIGVVRDVLVNIINVFASDYIVSGPVWEYFGEDPSQPWAVGLRREIELDLLNGFFGKTAIHPSQLPIIFDSLKVSRRDYDDAMQIIDWQGEGLAVSKGVRGDRMNELKCHIRWANGISARSKIYGIKE